MGEIHEKININMVNEERDLGVLFDDSLTFTRHIADIAKKANSKLGIIKRSFTSLDESSFTQLYKSIVCPSLEYCSTVWSLIYKKDEDILEKVKQRATKIIPTIRNLEYTERLKHLKLPTLTFRRQRADMLQLFKMMRGIDNVEVEKFFKIREKTSTRGHQFKIQKLHAKSKARQNIFSFRSINCWNSLPSRVVDSQSINQFKTQLKKHWSDHPLKYRPYVSKEMRFQSRGTYKL